jgi:hypothetical protein
MTLYHINPETGNANICRSLHGRCPFGTANEHFHTKEDARVAYEEKMDDLTEALQSIQKEIAGDRLLKTVTHEDGIGTALDIAGKYGLTNAEMRRIASDHLLEEEPDIEEIGSSDVSIHLAEMGNYGAEELEARAKEFAAFKELFAPHLMSGGARGESNGLHMNPQLTKVGDRFVGENGEIYEVTSIQKEGTYGLTQGHGKQISLTAVRSDGTVHIGDYTKNVVEGAHFTPDQFKELRVENEEQKLQRELKQLETSPGRYQYGFPEDEMTRYNIEQKIKAKKDELIAKGFTPEPEKPRPIRSRFARGWGKGKRQYNDVVMGSIQYNKVNPGTTPTTAEEAGMKTVIVPNIKRLTDKKRVQIAEELYRVSGRDMNAWRNSSDEEKLRFSKRYLGRYGEMEVDVTQDNKISWSHSNGMASGHDEDDVALLDFSRTS